MREREREKPFLTSAVAINHFAIAEEPTFFPALERIRKRKSRSNFPIFFLSLYPRMTDGFFPLCIHSQYLGCVFVYPSNVIRGFTPETALHRAATPSSHGDTDPHFYYSRNHESFSDCEQRAEFLIEWESVRPCEDENERNLPREKRAQGKSRQICFFFFCLHIMGAKARNEQAL